MLCGINRGSKILFVAIGGGGDIASAAVLAESFKSLGFEYVLASIAWERYVNDPVPGPIRIGEIVNTLKESRYYVLVTGSSYAIRNGSLLKFQASRVSDILKRGVYVIDMYSGVRGYVDALREISGIEDVDLVIGVDVGGDSLASGCEEGLWSPLADWVGLASIASVKGVLAVHSPGSDGELEQDYILSRLDHLAQRKALIGVKTLCERDVELLEEVLTYVDSEASRIPLLAYKGYRGEIDLRRGSRRVKSTLFNTFTFFLDAERVVEEIEPAKSLVDTSSLIEANSILNEYGIYTELDLEIDLFNLGIKPQDLSRDLLIKIREEGLKRTRNRARRPLCRGNT